MIRQGIDVDEDGQHSSCILYINYQGESQTRGLTILNVDLRRSFFYMDHSSNIALSFQHAAPNSV